MHQYSSPTYFKTVAQYFPIFKRKKKYVLESAHVRLCRGVSCLSCCVFSVRTCMCVSHCRGRCVPALTHTLAKDTPDNTSRNVFKPERVPLKKVAASSQIRGENLQVSLFGKSRLVVFAATR